ncbi:MAG: tetratricopeptide repeat protein [Verrucomicrobia bacterium]|nr:tetratricopeptide repeat protein [Verrucomicrobiota bacterium]
MQSLEPPDIHYLRAAIGWLELGNNVEARTELGKITMAQQNHPDVLEVRWLICAEEKSWGAALEAARLLVRRAPKRSSGWVHQAYALRRAPDGGLHAAWEALLPAHEKFPKEMIIPYNLACYACQLNQFEEALTWLKRALRIGRKERIKEMALNDPDLQPLWEAIRKL